jgi:hypothetical protein
MTNAVWYRSSETYAQSPFVELSQVPLGLTDKSVSFFLFCTFLRLLTGVLKAPDLNIGMYTGQLKVFVIFLESLLTISGQMPKLGHKNLLPYIGWRRCPTPA